MDFVKIAICFPHGVGTWLMETSDANRLVREHREFLKGHGPGFGEYRLASESHVNELASTRFVQISFAHVVYVSRLPS